MSVEGESERREFWDQLAFFSCVCDTVISTIPFIGELASASLEGLVSYVGNRVSVWWKKRKEKKRVLHLLENISNDTPLGEAQIVTLQNLIEDISKNDATIRKRIATKGTLKALLLSEIKSSKLFDESKSQEIVDSLLLHVREIISITTSDTDIYRHLLHHTELLEDVRSRLQTYEVRMKSVTDTILEDLRVRMTNPILVSPLEKVLRLSTIDAYTIETQIPNMELPKSQWCRRPHPEWIDIMEGKVFYQEEKIAELLESFNLYNMQLLIGAAGSGKTTLSLIMGYGLVHQGFSVFYIDANSLSGNNAIPTLTEINEVIQSYRIISKKSDNPPSGLYFIIDNIHYGEGLAIAKKLYNHYSELQSNIRFLFNARALTDDCTHYAEDISKKIMGKNPSTKLLQIHTLEAEDFAIAHRSILMGYLNSYSVDVKAEWVDEFIERLSVKVNRSLMLLAFILDSIHRLVDEGSSISSINVASLQICDAIAEHYKDVLDDFLNSSISIHFKTKLDDYKLYIHEVLIDVLVVLSAFNEIEGYIPWNYLNDRIKHPAISVDLLIELVNAIKIFMIENGEFVESKSQSSTEGRLLALPHISIARNIQSCFKTRYDELDLSESLDNWKDLLLYAQTNHLDISTHVNKLALMTWQMDEYHTQLIDWILENPELINAASEDSLEYIATYKIGNILRNKEWLKREGILSRTFFLDSGENIITCYSDEDLLDLGSSKGWETVLEDYTNITFQVDKPELQVKAIIAISSDDRQLRIGKGFSGEDVISIGVKADWSSLDEWISQSTSSSLERSDIHSLSRKILKETPHIANVLQAIDSGSLGMKDTEFFEILLHRTGDLVDAIHNSPVKMLELIFEYDVLMNDHQIQDAFLKQDGVIAKALISETDESWVFYATQKHQFLLRSPEIQSHIDLITTSLHNKLKAGGLGYIWMLSEGTIPLDEDIISGIIGKLHASTNLEIVFNMEAITSVDVLVKDSRILTSLEEKIDDIAKHLMTLPRPCWAVYWISRVNYLMNSARIIELLRKVSSKLARCILDKRTPFFVIEQLSSVVTKLDDTELTETYSQRIKNPI